MDEKEKEKRELQRIEQIKDNHALQPRAPGGRFLPNLHGPTLKAIQLMTTEGLEAQHAAERAGCRLATLQQALRKPHVKAYLKQQFAATRENAGQRAYLRLLRLEKETKNDRVKAEVNKWVAGVDGISPVTKVSGNINHNHQFGGFAFKRPPPVDVTPSTGDADD